MPENQSLKEKRRILKSIITRARNSYSVSVSEVEDQDSWQLATLGISYATNSKPQANEVLSKVVEFIRCGRFEVEIIDVEMEIVSF